jgi:hypothetical protein
MKSWEVRENCIMWSSITCTLRQINYNDKIKKDEMGRACNTDKEKRNAYRILVGKPEGKRPLGT